MIGRFGHWILHKSALEIMSKNFEKEIPETVSKEVFSEFFKYVSRDWRDAYVKWELLSCEKDEDSPVKYESIGVIQCRATNIGSILFIGKDIEFELTIGDLGISDHKRKKDSYEKCSFKLVDQGNCKVIKKGLVLDFKMLSLGSGAGIYMNGNGIDWYGILGG